MTNIVPMYESGLTVTINVTADPGLGVSWKSGNPIIRWGDGAATTNAVSGAYSHTYSSYSTYSIMLDGENDCGATCACEESITLYDCPTPTVVYPNDPEITFNDDGSVATCVVTLNTQDGNGPVAGTTILAYDGLNWVSMNADIDLSRAVQTITLSWDMVGTLTQVKTSLANSCGANSGVVETAVYEFACPLPKCSFVIG